MDEIATPQSPRQSHPSIIGKRQLIYGLTATVILHVVMACFGLAYFWQIVVEAWSAVWAFVFDGKAMMLWVVASVILIWTKGRMALKDSLSQWGKGLQIPALAAFVIYAFNIIYLAPKKITENAIGDSLKSNSIISALSGQLREFELRGPRLYKRTLVIKNDGVPENGKLSVEVTFTNESDYPAVDPEVFWQVAVEQYDGFKLINANRSVGQEMAPKATMTTSIDISVKLDVIEIPGVLDRPMNLLETPWLNSEQTVVVFVATRHTDPTTGKRVFNAPIIERAKWSKETKRAGKLTTLQVDERDRFVALFAPKYDQFKSSP
jgi:hypothetical protein